jgi:hypothetical protein
MVYPAPNQLFVFYDSFVDPLGPCADQHFDMVQYNLIGGG